jgi:hypothetical protein
MSGIKIIVDKIIKQNIEETPGPFGINIGAIYNLRLTINNRQSTIDNLYSVHSRE